MNGFFNRQGVAFVLVSGIGWLLDFGVYAYLTGMAGWTVSYANFFSAIPAVSFVFFMSTRHIFAKGSRRLSTHDKYIIYLLYQVLLVAIVSCLAQGLYNVLMDMGDLWQKTFCDYLSIIVKLVITPFTVLANFFVMKVLTEKL